MTNPPLHINCTAMSDEQMHVLDETCWCKPTVTVFAPSRGHARRAHRDVIDTIIDHHAQVRPAVQRDLDAAASFELAPPLHVVRTHRRLTSWTGVE